MGAALPALSKRGAFIFDMLFPYFFPFLCFQPVSFKDLEHGHHRQAREHGMLDDKLKNIAC